MFCRIDGCDNYIENHDKKLCATHNKESRKVVKPKKLYSIKPVSKKKSKALTAKKKAYQAMDDKSLKYCSGCGRSDRTLSHSHLIPVGQYPQFEAVEENIVYDCMSDMNGKGCHDIWEHGSAKEKEKLLNYQHRIKVVISLCPEYFHRMFTLKQ